MDLALGRSDRLLAFFSNLQSSIVTSAVTDKTTVTEPTTIATTFETESISTVATVTQYTVNGVKVKELEVVEEVPLIQVQVAKVSIGHCSFFISD